MRGLLLFAALLATLPLSAATAEWTGAGSPGALWSDAGNWVGGHVPVAGDDLVFPAGRPTTSVNDLPADTEVRSITVETTLSNRYTLSGNRIRLGAGGIRVSGAFDGGYGATHTIGFSIVLTASQSWILSVNSLAALIVTGDVEVGTHTLTIENRGLYGPLRFKGGVSGTGQIVTSENFTWFYGPTNFGGTVVQNGSHGWLRYIGTTNGAAHTLHNGARFQMNLGATTGAFTAAGGEWGGSGNTGNLVLKAGSTMRAGAAQESYTHGLRFETIHVTGTVKIEDATIGLNAMGGINVDMDIGSTVPAAVTPGQEFVIIDNDGNDPVDGRFAPWDGTVWHGFPHTPIDQNVDYALVYNGGDGNDVAVRAVPAGASTITTLELSHPVATAPISLIAKVTGGTSTPTGIVRFVRLYEQNYITYREVIGTVPVGAAGVATLTVSRAEGVFYAEYRGDLGHRPSQSEAIEAAAVMAEIPALGMNALIALGSLLAIAGAVLLRQGAV